MEERKEQQYTEEKIKIAIAEVKNGNSVRSVAKKHNIARSTLQRKMKGEVKLGTQKGPSTLFSTDEENNIVLWIKSMANAGFPVTKETLLYSIAKLAKECQVTFPGKDNLPGRKWYEAFLRRHPDISARTSQNLTISRHVTQHSINSWFLEVGSYFKNNKLEDVLRNPRRVFNCDETAFFLNPKPGKVLAVKGAKNVYTTSGADEKLNLTVLLTANAAGELAPPMVVYRYERIPQQVAEAIPDNWGIGKSENGWMTQQTFYEYVTNIFEPYLNQQGIEKPVVLFLDGHTSHLSLHLSKFCIMHGIEMVALLPNATHLIQPMDVAVFHTLKKTWRQEVVNFRMNHEGRQIEKHDFPVVLKSVLDCLNPETIISGFRACGLVPWDPEKVIIENKLPKEVTVSTKKREMVIFLRILEERIGKVKLETFLQNEGEWEGPVEQRDLYYLWLEAKTNLNMESFCQGSPASSINENQLPLEEETIAPVSPVAPIGPVVPVGPVVPIDPVAPVSPVASVGPVPTAEPSINVPSPFKRILFWPGKGDGKVIKKRKREKLPAVVTSPQMIQYYKKKESDQIAKAEEKERRKIERERKKIEKEEKKKTVDKKKKRARKPSSESSTSASFEASDYDECYDSVGGNESEEEGEPLQEESEVKEGQFVLVSVLGGKRNAQQYVYLCVIQEIHNKMIRVQGFKSTKNKNDFVVKENDKFHITFADIVAVVPQPQLQVKDRQLTYTFHKKLAVREKFI